MAEKKPIVTLGSTIQLIVRAFGVISGALVVIVLSRTLSVSEFGHFTTMLALIGLISSATEFGLSNTFIARYPKDNQKKLISAFFISKTVIGVLGFIVGALYVLVFFSNSMPINVSFVILSTLVFSGFTSLQTVLVARKNLNRQNLLLFAQSFVWLSVVLLGSFAKQDLMYFSVGFLISTLIQTTFTLLLSGSKLSIKFDGLSQNLKKLLRSSLFLALVGIFVALYYRIPSLAVYGILGPTSSSYFNVASRLIDVSQILPAAMLATYLPTLSVFASSANLYSLKQTWKTNLIAVLPASALVASLVTVNANLIVEVLFGDNYSNAVPVVQLLIWTFPLITFGWLLSPVFIATERTKTLALVSGVGLLTNISLSIWLTSWLGLFGASASSIVTEIVIVLGLSIAAYKMLDIQIDWKVLTKSLIASVLVLSVSALPDLFANSIQNQTSRLGLSSLLAFLLYWRLSLSRMNKDLSVIDKCHCNLSDSGEYLLKSKTCNVYTADIPHISYLDKEGRDFRILKNLIESYASGEAHLEITTCLDGKRAHTGATYIGPNILTDHRRIKSYLETAAKKTLIEYRYASNNEDFSNANKSVRSFKDLLDVLGLWGKAIVVGGLHLSKKIFSRSNWSEGSHNWSILISKVDDSESRKRLLDSQEISIAQATLADPFYFEWQGVPYLVAEKLKNGSNRGAITIFGIVEGTWVELGNPINGDHDQSFPFVFEYQGKIYMCPEESALERISLYELGSSPLNWSHKVILMHERAVDTVIFEKNGLWWMLTNKKVDGVRGFHNELFAYFADQPLTSEWTPHALNPIILDSRKARNGGLFSDEGKIYRVGQSPGFGEYGQSYAIYQITNISPTQYEEELTTSFDLIRAEARYSHHMHYYSGIAVTDFKRN